MTTKPRADEDHKESGGEAKAKASTGESVVYLGAAAERSFTAADLKRLDEDYDGGAVKFNRANNFTVEEGLTDKIAEALAADGEFVVGALTNKQAARLDDKQHLANNNRPLATSVPPEYLGG